MEPLASAVVLAAPFAEEAVRAARADAGCEGCEGSGAGWHLVRHTAFEVRRNLVRDRRRWPGAGGVALQQYRWWFVNRLDERRDGLRFRRRSVKEG